MNKNLKYLVMLLSVAVVFLSLFIGSVSADAIQTLSGPIGGNAPGNNGPGGLDLGGGGAGGLGSNSYLIIAIIAIVAVVAVLLIIKFVLPKIRQNK